jgi:hypothetical protein
MDPETLLLQYRFLFDTDFEELGSGLTAHQLIWLADMKSALSATSLSQMGLLSSQATEFFLGQGRKRGSSASVGEAGEGSEP